MLSLSLGSLGKKKSFVLSINQQKTMGCTSFQVIHHVLYLSVNRHSGRREGKTKSRTRRREGKRETSSKRRTGERGKKESGEEGGERGRLRGRRRKRKRRGRRRGGRKRRRKKNFIKEENRGEIPIQGKRAVKKREGKVDHDQRRSRGTTSGRGGQQATKGEEETPSPWKSNRGEASIGMALRCSRPSPCLCREGAAFLTVVKRAIRSRRRRKLAVVPVWTVRAEWQCPAWQQRWRIPTRPTLR